MKSSLSAPPSDWMKSSTRSAFLMLPCSFRSEVCVGAQRGLMSFTYFNKEMEENICFNVVGAHSHAAMCPGPDLWASSTLNLKKSCFICVTEAPHHRCLLRGKDDFSNIHQKYFPVEQSCGLIKANWSLFLVEASDVQVLQSCVRQDVFHTHTLQPCFFPFPTWHIMLFINPWSCCVIYLF